MLTKVYNEPRIFQIDVPLPDNPLRNLNCYVVQDGGETLLLIQALTAPNVGKRFWKGLQSWMRIGRKRTFSLPICTLTIQVWPLP